MDRSPKASLSPREFAALRAVKRGCPDISAQDRILLLSMGLVVADGKAMRLSPTGASRLEREERENPEGY